MADETTRADQWITSILTADTVVTAHASGGVHAEYAPRSTVSPWVVHSLVSAVDVAGAASNRVMVTGTWKICAVGESESYGGAIQTLADQIDTLFHGQPAPGSMVVGSIGGASILSSTRISPFRLAEEVDGVHFRHLGGLYRISIQIP